MKPQDLVILLKIISLENKDWQVNDLARSLHLSQSEVSKGLRRLAFSGLLDENKKNPAKNSIYDLIVNSVRYIFPVKPGQVLKGIATAHSLAPLKNKIRSEINYVWPCVEGDMRGESIEPLYKNLPKAALEDQKLYELLALIDALRVGKVREQEIAKVELSKRFGLAR